MKLTEILKEATTKNVVPKAVLVWLNQTASLVDTIGDVIVDRSGKRGAMKWSEAIANPDAVKPRKLSLELTYNTAERVNKPEINFKQLLPKTIIEEVVCVNGVVSDWSDLLVPTRKLLEFSYTEFKTFKLPSSLKLTEIVFASGCTFEATNMLGLLNGNIEKIKVDVAGKSKEQLDVPSLRAMQLISKALAEKTPLAEVTEQLIDADLGDYARL